jgi:hypothetical protein
MIVWGNDVFKKHFKIGEYRFMNIKNLNIILVATLALASATSAFGVVTCDPKIDNGAGEVELFIQSDGVGGILDAVDIKSTGVVSITSTDCVVGSTDCSVLVQGTPGSASNQGFILAVEDSDGIYGIEAGCFITKADGLPVELSTFKVE